MILVDGDAAGVEGLDFGCIVVDADDRMSELCEACGSPSGRRPSFLEVILTFEEEGKSTPVTLMQVSSIALSNNVEG